MSAIIIFTAISIAQFLLMVAMAIAALRMFVGPRAQDRIIGLDTPYINAMLLLPTFRMATGRPPSFAPALVIGLFGFVTTLTLAKFLMRVDVIEYPIPPTTTPLCFPSSPHSY